MQLNLDNLNALAQWLEPQFLIGQMALLHGAVSEAQLRECVEEQRRSDPTRQVEEILLARGYLTPERLAELRRMAALLQYRDSPLAPPADQVKRLVGRYALTEGIGVGGAGVVWKAWDSQLQRWVALKMPRADQRVPFERFLREARAAARVRHPSLIEIFEFGRHEDVDYIVMEYIDGAPLDEAPLFEHRALAALMAEVCDAVHTLHSNGIIHRDIKPQNILIDAKGKARLGDFGLARIAGSRPLTTEGTLLGTPQYMAPEQASVRQDAIGPRTDVYALGATLFHAATGHMPYEGENQIEPIIKKLMDDEAPRPRDANPAVPRELEIVIMRAMAKHPYDRYPTASALGEDLRRFERGEAILAHPSNIATRAYKWVRRNKRMAAATCVAAISAVFAVAAAVSLFRLNSPEWTYNAALSKGNQAWCRVVEHISRVPVDREELRHAAEEARSHFMKAALGLPDRSFPHLMQGRCLLLLGREGEAREALESALKRTRPIDPDYGAQLVELGTLYVGTNARTAGLPGLQIRDNRVEFEVTDFNSAPGSALLEQGDRLLRQGGQIENPERPVLDALKGALAFREKRYDAAASALRAYAREAPWNVPALALLGAVEYLNRDFQSAEGTWSRVLDLVPPQGDLYRSRGDARLCLRRFDEALADYGHAVKMRKDDPVFLCQRGLATLARNRTPQDVDDAIADFNAALKSDPDFVHAYAYRGLAHLSRNDYDGAESDFSEATFRRQDYVEAYVSLGDIHRAMGRFRTAVDDYDFALRYAPETWERRRELEATIRALDSGGK